MFRRILQNGPLLPRRLIAVLLLFGSTVAAASGQRSSSSLPGADAPSQLGRPDPLNPFEQAALQHLQLAYEAIRETAAYIESTNFADGSDLLAQSRNGYEQAVADYRAWNFKGTVETAGFSWDLARAAIEMAHAHRIASLRSEVVEPQQDVASTASGDFEHLEQHRAAVTARMRAQPETVGPGVRRLVDESGRLQQNAKILMSNNKVDEADATIRAANALLGACDHSMSRVLLPTGRNPDAGAH
jgi:hypothetical protein